MISAKEAREKVISLSSIMSKEQIKSCEIEIEKAINLQAFGTNINFSLSLPVKDYLETLGYKVEYGSKYNESYTYISW